MLTYKCDSCEEEFEMTYREATECVYPDAIRLCPDCDLARKLDHMVSGYEEDDY